MEGMIKKILFSALLVISAALAPAAALAQNPVNIYFFGGRGARIANTKKNFGPIWRQIGRKS